MKQPTGSRRLPGRIARASDDLLDFLVLGFAAWTVIYHVCLVLNVGAAAAGVVGVAALVPSGWFAFRRSESEPGGPNSDCASARHRRPTVARAVNLLAATSGAALFAVTSVAWRAVWLLWVVAAGAAVISSLRRAGHTGGDTSDETPGRAPPDDASPGWPATLVALAWAAGLGVLSLFIVNPDGDDTQYVHLSSWIAAHGEFPLRDTLFSDQVLPAIIFPPLASFEPLVGVVALGTGVAVPDIVYFALPPVATALAVLATWRLLRSWNVRMVSVALSMAMLFLLFDAGAHRTLGNLFISRIWQGKIVFLAVLVPLLFVMLGEYVERPTRRMLAMLGAVGIAAVGLSTTGVFLVPVIAGGCLAPLALRSARQAAAGFVATAGYPLGAGAVTFMVGGRNAKVYTEADVDPERLVHFVLRDGALAFVGLTAVLVGPVLIRRAFRAEMTAATVLLVGCLYAPLVPLVVFRLTDLGQVQWRWIWAVPTAALVGLVAAHATARISVPALRPLPAVLLCAVLVVWGTPVWSAAAGATLASEPSWKRSPQRIEAARRILAHARPGDVILAPRLISQTVLVMSGTVATVAPRPSYTRALRDAPGGHPRERLLLLAFAEHGLGPVETSRRRFVEASEVTRALGVVRVDIACVPKADPAARRLLLAGGYSLPVTSETVSCLRRPAPGEARDP